MYKNSKILEKDLSKSFSKLKGDFGALVFLVVLVARFLMFVVKVKNCLKNWEEV